MAFSRRNFLVATGVAAAGTTLLTACGSDDSGSGGSGGGKPSQGGVTGGKAEKIELGTKADSQGPAPEVEGAKKGGTLYTMDQIDADHLDPAQIWSAYEGWMTPLFMRGLVGYKVDVKTGKCVLVGDAATDTGTAKDGGKTWVFTLKDGLKWEDGKDLTVDDVKHTFERLFAKFVTFGPRYPQQWLIGGDKYKGPYEGKHLDSIEVDKDAKTITFNLKEAHGDFNFCLTMRAFSLVPKHKDTKEDYDKKPFSCGPYKISSRKVGKSMLCVRNEHWDAKTDPIRNAYPDKFQFQFGYQPLASTDRYIADQGKDQYTFSLLNEVAPERVQQVLGGGKYKDRILTHLDVATYYWAINTTRIKDVQVRKALQYAFPLSKLQVIRGGAATSEMATTIMNPLTPGHADFDLYDKKKKPAGDPAKAKELLKKAGKLGQKVVIAYQQSENALKQAVAIKNSLEAAGFKVVNKQVDKASFYSQIAQLDNDYDLFAAGWSPDWPGGYTALQPTFDGRVIANGASNWPQLNNKSVNKAIDAASQITDVDESNKAYGAIDKQIMDLAAAIPDYWPIRNWFHGSKVGGFVYSAGDTGIDISKLYAKA
ncbi:ABC transporter substrate-binding protein [Streptomyces sp. NPDC049954]|uniref:ABC transporter substrate-binding protein n=1 Tax=Streptomyces sp. NPDC049954 TaxID=3155779 RepID=UPI003442EA8F